ncbi:MAG TPA: hypothetical protein VFC02_24335 [Anaerolineales bacterium]|nr:hypothetical protein [Anaerolineales bacterium]
MEYFIADEKCARLLQLRNEKFKRDYEQEKREYEQRKRDLIQERRDKIQAAKDEIQYLKEYGITENLYGVEGRRIFGGPIYMKQVIDTGHQMTKEQFLAQEKYKNELADRIIMYEQNKISLPREPVLQSMHSLPQKIDDIHTVAIQAGMTFHEIEDLIEWRLKSFSEKEIKSLQDWIRWYLAGWELHFEKKPATWQLAQLNQFCIAIFELSSHLKEKPIKIPSGHYDETLRVERTQQDLNNDMVQELLDLQPHTAYVKKATWKGKIQTVVVDKAASALLAAGRRQLVDVRGSARKNAIENHILRHRSEIEEEIRKRQNGWQTSPNTEPQPPPTTSGSSTPSLPAGGSGHDREPPPPPTQIVPKKTPEEKPPGTKSLAGRQKDLSGGKPGLACRQTGLPVEFVSLRFYESGHWLPEHERRYSMSFSRHSARFVNVVLTMASTLQGGQRKQRVKVKIQ